MTTPKHTKDHRKLGDMVRAAHQSVPTVRSFILITIGKDGRVVADTNLKCIDDMHEFLRRMINDFDDGKAVKKPIGPWR